MLAHLGRPATLAELDPEVTAGQQGLDSLEAGHRAGHAEEGEGVVDAAAVGAGVDHAGGQQSLDLRGEQEPLAGRGLLPGPIERADAEAVAAQDESLSLLVPQGNGELAAQVLEHPLLVVLPGVRDDFGVAVGAELVAAPCQAGPGLGVVEQLAVEDDVHAVVLVADGLAAVEQPDDAEAARGEAEAGLFEIPILVRAAVDDAIRHGPEAAGRHRRARGQVNHSGNAAHRLFLSERRFPSHEHGTHNLPIVPQCDVHRLVRHRNLARKRTGIDVGQGMMEHMFSSVSMRQYEKDLLEEAGVLQVTAAEISGVPVPCDDEVAVFHQLGMMHDDGSEPVADQIDKPNVRCRHPQDEMRHIPNASQVTAPDDDGKQELPDTILSLAFGVTWHHNDVCGH